MKFWQFFPAALLLTLAEAANSQGFNACSEVQEQFSSDSISEALSLAIAAHADLENTPSPNPTYIEWFGAPDDSRLAQVKAHFADLISHLTIGVLSVDCTCTPTAEQNGVRAYAIVANPYEVHLCTGFFALHQSPIVGFNTRGGVLLHEVSHFEIVNDLIDLTPGVAAARQRAISDPAMAIRSAYNHHFYAENLAGAQ